MPATQRIAGRGVYLSPCPDDPAEIKRARPPLKRSEPLASERSRQEFQAPLPPHSSLPSSPPGKRTRLSEYPVKGRGGLGVKTVQLTDVKGKLAGARVVRPGYQVMVISTGGTVIRVPVDGIRIAGRKTQGVIVFNTTDGERVVSVERIGEEEGSEVDADETEV